MTENPIMQKLAALNPKPAEWTLDWGRDDRCPALWRKSGSRAAIFLDSPRFRQSDQAEDILIGTEFAPFKDGECQNGEIAFPTFAEAEAFFA